MRVRIELTVPVFDRNRHRLIDKIVGGWVEATEEQIRAMRESIQGIVANETHLRSVGKTRSEVMRGSWKRRLENGRKP
jgi:hypothetical protein